MLEGTSVTEPPLNWIVLPETETGLIALLKFTLTNAFVPTLAALLEGASETMVGAALSTRGPGARRNRQEHAAAVFDARDHSGDGRRHPDGMFSAAARKSAERGQRPGPLRADGDLGTGGGVLDQI